MIGRTTSEILWKKISIVTWSKFAIGLLSSANAREIAVDRVLVRFRISSSVLEIFAADV